jgi:insertion element IS1 protein InsB
MYVMIEEYITYTCSRCGSPNIVRNGHNKCGNPQYQCKDCKAHRVLKPKQLHPLRTRQQVLRAYRERMSLRGVERVFDVCLQTVMTWLQEYMHTLPPLLICSDLPKRMMFWSWTKHGRLSVKRLINALWTALCRRTRQIIAFVIGDRSDETCDQLWKTVLEAYRHCHSFSDFWKAYTKVFPQSTHQSVGKETGETAHQER